MTGRADVDWVMGQAVGWEAGYRAGFTAGADIGAAGVLLVIQSALPDGVLPSLLPGLPYTGEYQRLQQLRAHTTDSCPRRCGRCSACVYAAVVARNLARYGSPDYPGGRVDWATPTPACEADARTTYPRNVSCARVVT